MLPIHVTMVDAVSEILHLSTDSAYRRLRGETPLLLDEAAELCRHFNLSLDRLLEMKSDSVVFRNIRINRQEYTFEKYMSDLLGLIRQFNSFQEKEIIYLTKDVPIVHNFYYPSLTAFRYYFWMKNIIQHPEFKDRGFTTDCIPAEMEKLCRELAREYSKIPSVEIWNSECINSTLSQIEFCKDSGLFPSFAAIKTVYEELEETILHLRAQAESGMKFMPGENPESAANNFRFFFNRVVLGDNTVYVSTGQVVTVYLNYGVLDYMATRDSTFCKQCYDDMHNLMRKSTLISQTSEKQRNIFFGILLSKIQDRKRKL